MTSTYETLPQYTPTAEPQQQTVQQAQIPTVRPANYGNNQERYNPQTIPVVQPAQVTYYTPCSRKTRRMDRRNKRQLKYSTPPVPVFTTQQPEYYPTGNEKADLYASESQYPQYVQNPNVPINHYHRGISSTPHGAYHVPTICSKRPVTMMCPFENVMITTKVWVKPKGIAFLSMGALIL
ncbi:hypothetical protein HK098_005250, partial [Nowakowskiella sp. JEL0407]